MFYLKIKKIKKNTTLKFHDFWPFCHNSAQYKKKNSKKQVVDFKPLRLPLEKASNSKRQPFAVGYLFPWQPWPSATFAAGNLFRRQKVAVGQGFHQKRLPSATFTIRKGFWWQRLPMAIGNLFQWQPLPSEKVTDGNLCHRPMVKVADGNLLPLEKVSDGKRLPMKKIDVGKGLCSNLLPSKAFSNGKGCHQKPLPLEKVSDGICCCW